MKDVLKNLTQNSGMDKVESDRWEMLCVKSFPLSQPIGQLLGLGPFWLVYPVLVRYRVCIIPNVISLPTTAVASWSGGKAGWNFSAWGELFQLCLKLIGGIACLQIF